MKEEWCENCHLSIYRLFYQKNGSDHQIADLLFCPKCQVFYILNTQFDEYVPVSSIFIDERENIKSGALTVELDLNGFYIGADQFVRQEKILQSKKDSTMYYKVFYTDKHKTIHHVNTLAYCPYNSQLLMGNVENTFTTKDFDPVSFYIDPYLSK